MKKICTKCNISKDYNLFNNNKNNKDGKSYECKECKLERRRSIDGLINSIYSHQKKSSKFRNHNQPNYSKEELKEWILLQFNFEELYDNWVKSNYNKDLIPSVDRLDDYKGYSFDNIRLTIWRKNSLKSNEYMINGKNNKQSKIVYQYDLKGLFIKEYYSLSQASRKTNISLKSISKVCRKEIIQSHNYFWSYRKITEKDIIKLRNHLNNIYFKSQKLTKTDYDKIINIKKIT